MTVAVAVGYATSSLNFVDFVQRCSPICQLSLLRSPWRVPLLPNAGHVIHFQERILGWCMIQNFTYVRKSCNPFDFPAMHNCI